MVSFFFVLNHVSVGALFLFLIRILLEVILYFKMYAFNYHKNELICYTISK